jgi:hypothetical protein
MIPRPSGSPLIHLLPKTPVPTRSALSPIRHAFTCNDGGYGNNVGYKRSGAACKSRKCALESTGCRKRLGGWFTVMLKVRLPRNEERRLGLRQQEKDKMNGRAPIAARPRSRVLECTPLVSSYSNSLLLIFRHTGNVKKDQKIQKVMVIFSNKNMYSTSHAKGMEDDLPYLRAVCNMDCHDEKIVMRPYRAVQTPIHDNTNFRIVRLTLGRNTTRPVKNGKGEM